MIEKAEKAKFIFDQAQLCLKTSIESGDLIVGKCFQLFKINIAIMAITAGALVMYSSKSIFMTNFLCVLLVLSLISCLILISGLNPRAFIPLGNTYENLTLPNYHDQHYEAMLLVAAITCDDSLVKSRIFNKAAAEKLNLVILLTITNPIVAICSACIVN